MSNERGNGRQKLLAIGVVIALALLTVQAYGVLAGAGSQKPADTVHASTAATSNDTITVSGTGEVQIPPDRAILTIGVVTQATTAESAVQQNANAMSSVIAALEGIGISNSSIQTTNYNISPQSSCCTGPPTITGYQVTNEVQVTILASGQGLGQLAAKTGQAIDAAASQGANDIYGVQFTASDSELQQATQNALQLAVQDASSQAHTIASALSVSITGVVSATSSPQYAPIFTPAIAGTSAATPIVPPQSLTVSATVQVVYSIS